jgi:N-acetylmuramoyl-L-alanine amidase
MQPSEDFPQSRRSRRASLNVLRQLYVVFGVGAMLATLYTAWTPLGLVPTGLAQQLAGVFDAGNPNSADGLWPTPTPRPRPLIGLVAGHWGNDSGTVCPDGLTEVDVNLIIATRVKEKLTAQGFDVDLLEEFDDRLPGYQSLALVSIHADTCQFIDDNATGFKVSAALGNTPEKVSRLVACLRTRYESVTGLRFHSGSITTDMSSYHTFDEIHSETTAAIIETGFLNLDRQVLTGQPDRIAEGIAQGILCYIYNEDASSPEGN